MKQPPWSEGETNGGLTPARKAGYDRRSCAFLQGPVLTSGAGPPFFFTLTLRCNARRSAKADPGPTYARRLTQRRRAGFLGLGRGS